MCLFFVAAFFPLTIWRNRLVLKRLYVSILASQYMNTEQPPTKLIQLPTEQLLAKFGAGGHKPGSGSAAALISLVSCKLLETVITLTKGRDRYKDVHDQLTLANQHVLSEIEPILSKALQDDAIQFDRVIQIRVRRDAESDPIRKRNLRELHLEELRIATEIPLRIAESSLDLAEKSLTVFDLGFKSARGDSAVAISAAVSGAIGSLSIVFLNLGSFKGGKWAQQTRSRAEELMRRAQAYQLELFKRMTQLNEEAEVKHAASE